MNKLLDKLVELMPAFIVIGAIWLMFYICFNLGSVHELGEIQITGKQYVASWVEHRTNIVTDMDGNVSYENETIHHPEEFNVTMCDTKYGYSFVKDDQHWFNKYPIRLKMNGMVTYRTWKGEINGVWSFKLIEQ